MDFVLSMSWVHKIGVKLTANNYAFILVIYTRFLLIIQLIILCCTKTKLFSSDSVEK